MPLTVMCVVMLVLIEMLRVDGVEGAAARHRSYDGDLVPAAPFDDESTSNVSKATGRSRDYTPELIDC